MGAVKFVRAYTRGLFNFDGKNKYGYTLKNYTPESMFWYLVADSHISVHNLKRGVVCPSFTHFSHLLVGRPRLIIYMYLASRTSVEEILEKH